MSWLELERLVDEAEADQALQRAWQEEQSEAGEHRQVRG